MVFLGGNGNSEMKMGEGNETTNPILRRIAELYSRSRKTYKKFESLNETLEGIF